MLPGRVRKSVFLADVLENGANLIDLRNADDERPRPYGSLPWMIAAVEEDEALARNNLLPEVL
jgi:hypothetical protein